MTTKPHDPPTMGRRRLQQVMTHLSEGVILLDPAGPILWANHAALDMHGCATLEELGESTSQYAKRFTLCESGQRQLKTGQTPLARLTAGDTFSGLTLELTRRDGQGITRTLMFRGMVLSDESNQPEMLVLFIVDTTEKVGSDELFDRFFSSKPSPAAILRLDDSRYIRTNDGFCEMTGFSAEDILGRPFHEIDVLHDAQWRDQAVRALATHTAIRPQESRVRTADGDSKAVMVAGQPIVVMGRPCMLFSFIDLEARRRAEQSLRQSEERFAKAFRMAPVPMAVCIQSNWCVIEANGAFVTAVGRSRNEIIGRTVTSAGLHLDQATLRDIRVALDANQMIRNRDAQLRASDGLVIDGLLSAESVMIQDEACALFVIQDITERKRTESELISAIEAVMKDASWFSRTVMEKLAQVRRPQVAMSEVDTLTAREREVLELICNGQGDAEIAQRLRLSRNTVRNHVATLYGKIGVNRRSAAVIWGRERGFGTD
ncbi:helix-turn-helix transcriptional regulator [Xanthomonadaceae bacterium JHOS43]|nr:helix-turn-helix transcriptional regulator [Xanthomonadaceae bacterium JHOS43]